MVTRGAKDLLRNTIRHMDFHNRLLEEEEMWKQWEVEKGLTMMVTDDFIRKRMHSDTVSDGDDDFPRRGKRTVDSKILFQHKEAARRSDGQSSSYWSRKLMEAEEKDPDRWGHSGYKELYPEEFGGGKKVTPTLAPSSTVSDSSSSSSSCSSSSPQQRRRQKHKSKSKSKHVKHKSQSRHKKSPRSSEDEKSHHKPNRPFERDIIGKRHDRYALAKPQEVHSSRIFRSSDITNMCKMDTQEHWNGCANQTSHNSRPIRKEQSHISDKWHNGNISGSDGCSDRLRKTSALRDNYSTTESGECTSSDSDESDTPRKIYMKSKVVAR